MAERSRSRSGRPSGRRRDGEVVPRPVDADGRLSVLVEMRAQPGSSPSMTFSQAAAIDGNGFALDHEFQPVSLGADRPEALAAGAATFVVRGTLEDEKLEALRAQSEVMDVWLDTPIAPFQRHHEPHPQLVEEGEAMAACPIPPCDCAPGTPKGSIADVAMYLGVNQIWSAGFRGAGMVVGVVDGGITAQGRPVKDGETDRRIPRVVGGWPSDWGTEASKWGEHGNMCATDVLGMAPEAQVYDFRVSGAGGSPGTISRALQAFQWAIDRHRVDGTPHALTNSWGIFQEAWDTTYARNPNHLFTRKVVEAINEGILVLFAAGNCGDTCPDGRCGTDVGPGKSIWGANGHPLVMTVGAVNRNEEFVGYSSRGPAALDPNKPDFCSVTHFTGYFDSDSGTSAATPVLAGVVALLKQAKPTATQESVKSCLKSTAKDIGPAGFDQHSGAGIVQGKRAFDCLRGIPPRPTLFGPGCPRPTHVGPRCPRPTLAGPRCPRPTLGPRCPRPTLFEPGCPRFTLVGPRCPRPTLAGPECPPRVSLDVRCPRPTLSAACPRPTLACGTPPGIGYNEEPYGHEWWYPEEEWHGPYRGQAYPYEAWEEPYPEEWHPAPGAYGAGYDPYLDEWYRAQEPPYGDEWSGPPGGVEPSYEDPYAEGDYWYWWSGPEG